MFLFPKAADQFSCAWMSNSAKLARPSGSLAVIFTHQPPNFQDFTIDNNPIKVELEFAALDFIKQLWTLWW